MTESHPEMQVKAEITVAVGVRHREYLDVGNAWYWAVGADGQTVPRGQRQQDWSLKRVCRDRSFLTMEVTTHTTQERNNMR